jgi:hypothetical protein
MPKLYERVPAGKYRGRRWSDLTLDQLHLLRKLILAEISRKQEAAGDTGPVVVGAALVVGEIDFVARRWAELMRLRWHAGERGGRVAEAVIADGQERLQRLLLEVCLDERGEACDRTGAGGGEVTA